MDKLSELTGKKSGIVLRRHAPAFVGSWAGCLGLPHCFTNDFQWMGETFKADKIDFEDFLLGFLPPRLDYGGRLEPQRGMVYYVDDFTVIAPDEWE